MKFPTQVHVSRAQRCFLTLTYLATLTASISGSQNKDWWFPSQRGASSTLAGLRLPNQAYLQRGNDGADLRCAQLLSDVRLTEETLTTKLPPNITGRWLSQRCETRPGPVFLLRKYSFSPNRSFELEQFYYSDHLCSLPIYVIHAEGSVQMTSPSWTVPGGMETDYVLSKVQLLTYTTNQTAVFYDNFNRSCPSSITVSGEKWSTRRWYTIYKYRNEDSDLQRKPSIQMAQEAEFDDDFDCLDTLGIVFHELQLMRIEYRKRKHGIKRWKNRKIELLLGDAIYDPANKHYYRPTSYQPPLIKSDQVNICAICRLVNKGSALFPPHLDTQLTYQYPRRQLFQGEWVSTRCETRPFTMFLTRQITYYDDTSTHAPYTPRRLWKSVYDYYLDSRCRKPTFSLTIRGKYENKGASRRVDGATDVDFEVDTMMVTPHTVEMVNTLNDNENGRCGLSGRWMLGHTQDVTSSNGCASLGLVAPAIEYEISKIETDRYGNSWLYLGGQSAPVENFINSQNESEIAFKRRPTSYQLPLLQCRQRASLEEDAEVDNSLRPMPETIIVSSRLQAQDNAGNSNHYLRIYVMFTAVLIHFFH